MPARQESTWRHAFPGRSSQRHPGSAVGKPSGKVRPCTPPHPRQQSVPPSCAVANLGRDLGCPAGREDRLQSVDQVLGVVGLRCRVELLCEGDTVLGELGHELRVHRLLPRLADILMEGISLGDELPELVRVRGHELVLLLLRDPDEVAVVTAQPTPVVVSLAPRGGFWIGRETRHDCGPPFNAGSRELAPWKSAQAARASEWLRSRCARCAGGSRRF
mmetsp:Transcript_7042/g.24451  ORF Transcript_7042/g.24451 Transcript_7042/m.24451 type:complete len:218 (-) Transcript_7042:50-703(-)